MLKIQNEIGLYPRLLGSDWPLLPPSLQKLLTNGKTRYGRGSFRIHYGNNPLARMIVWFEGLPTGKEPINTEILITGTGEEETWRRKFHSKVITTSQRIVCDHLAEQFSFLDFLIKPEYDQERRILNFRSVKTCLRIVGKDIGLPGPLAPKISAKTWEVGPEKVAVDMSVIMPIFGLIWGYTGELNIE